MGDESEWSYPGDGEGPVHEIEIATFRDRPLCREQSAVRRVSSRQPGGGPTPRSSNGPLSSGGCFPTTSRPHVAWRAHRGGAKSWARIGSILRGRTRTSRIGRIIPLSTSRGTMLRLIATGQGPACRQRPSGRSLPGGDSMGEPFPWGDQLEPGGTHQMNVFQGEFPGRQYRCRRVSRYRPGRCIRPQRIWPPQHVRQCLGMVCRLAGRAVLPHVSRPSTRRTVVRHVPRPAGRVLPVPFVVLPPLPGVRPLRQRAGQLKRQCWIPGGRLISKPGNRGSGVLRQRAACLTRWPVGLAALVRKKSPSSGDGEGLE